MILVRAWRQQLWGGLGASLIVPGALLGALAVLGLAGGFAGLGSLGQAFSGPALPSSAPSPVSGGHPAAPLSTVVLAALASQAGSVTRSGAAPAGGHSAAPSTRPSPSPTPSGVRPAAPTPSTRGGSAGSSPQPPSKPTLTDQVVGTGSSAAGQLPSPAGSAGAGALQSAGSAVDQVAPVSPPGTPRLP